MPGLLWLDLYIDDAYQIGKTGHTVTIRWAVLVLGSSNIKMGLVNIISPTILSEKTWLQEHNMAEIQVCVLEVQWLLESIVGEIMVRSPCKLSSRWTRQCGWTTKL